MKLLPILLSLLLAACSDGTSFDRERWKSADLMTRERAEIIPALEANHPLVGLTRAQVIELLGPPTSTDKWDDWDMIYVLGPTEYIPIDNEWLVIKLDKSSRVAKYRTIAD